MLFMSFSCSSLAVSRDAEFAPGEHWEYSGGDSNLLSELIKRKVCANYTSFFLTEVFSGNANGAAILHCRSFIKYQTSLLTVVLIPCHQVGGDLFSFLRFARSEFLDKLGMDSTTLEVDATGTYVGSSFTYATARDWARFGLLYTNVR